MVEQVLVCSISGAGPVRGLWAFEVCKMSSGHTVPCQNRYKEGDTPLSGRTMEALPARFVVAFLISMEWRRPWSIDIIVLQDALLSSMEAACIAVSHSVFWPWYGNTWNIAGVLITGYVDAQTSLHQSFYNIHELGILHPSSSLKSANGVVNLLLQKSKCHRRTLFGFFGNICRFETSTRCKRNWFYLPYQSSLWEEPLGFGVLWDALHGEAIQHYILLETCGTF